MEPGDNDPEYDAQWEQLRTNAVAAEMDAELMAERVRDDRVIDSI